MYIKYKPLLSFLNKSNGIFLYLYTSPVVIWHLSVPYPFQSLYMAILSLSMFTVLTISSWLISVCFPYLYGGVCDQWGAHVIASTVP